MLFYKKVKESSGKGKKPGNLFQEERESTGRKEKGKIKTSLNNHGLMSYH